MANPITHVEILAKSGKKVRQFYAKAFGWKMQHMKGMDYAMVGGRGAGSGVGLGATARGEKKSVVAYIDVKDMTKAVAKVKKAGGRIVQKPETIPGMVTYAIFKDTAGNVLGLAKSERKRR